LLKTNSHAGIGHSRYSNIALYLETDIFLTWFLDVRCCRYNRQHAEEGGKKKTMAGTVEGESGCEEAEEIRNIRGRLCFDLMITAKR